ncbi:Chitin synthase 6 [Oopsacas minuta]|uniref:chitin synthase n=1 Tax=Oopsacas minuta TaxID=111878 RepID=A0AAV7JAP8_9METZ|nr:Chitin synthase 6 [Oopsacas minuta]
MAEETKSITNERLTEIRKLPKLPEPKDNELDNIDRDQPELQKRVYTVLKWLVGWSLFVCMLASLILNQMTLAKTISLLNIAEKENHKMKGFVMLMFIILVPNLFNAVRCYLVGTFSKTATSYPWPNRNSLIIGVSVSILEILCIVEILFFSGPHLEPDIFLLLLAGTFSTTILLQLRYICKQDVKDNMGIRAVKSCMLIVSFIVHTMAILGILAVLIAACVKGVTGSGNEAVKISSHVLLIASLFILSVLWSPNIQNLTIQPNLKFKTLKDALFLEFVETKGAERGMQANARWKGGMIYSCVKFFTFLFIAPVAFFLLNIKETSISNFCTDTYCAFDLKTDLSFVLAVNILLALLVYAMGYMACSIRSQQIGFFIPLILSTPLTVFLINLMQSWETWPNITHTMLSNYTNSFNTVNMVTYRSVMNVTIILLGIALLATPLTYTYTFFKNSKVVMATDDLLFHLPSYNPIFLAEYFLLNRRVERTMLSKIDGPFAKPKDYDNAYIFICSTMYHESEKEMRNLLLSIKSVADAAASGFLKQKFESHIFFDGANQGNDLNLYAMRLISLLEECFDVGLEDGRKRYTPYGIQLAWVVSEQLRFVIHCKNGKKVKNKKRWSQVMYMYYTLFYRIPRDNHVGDQEDNYERTFILTTDADIVFTPESVKSLIEMLSRDRTVGAVCARTHPLGSGPIVWYQIFDYAVGHWFQKVAENILGSVLCCPGCFSLFRASALKDVVQIYAGNVSLAKDFLTKDMGEDRWLCTLLVQHGWRLEYCAVSENFTFCPDHFEEFYKQRRRWIPSTLANLFELVSSGSRIVKKNNFISYLFVFYQILNIISTILSPGSVIIVLVGGLAVALQINQYIILVVQLGIAGAFMLTCLYTSQKTQLNTAKILTGVYAFMMAAVVIGLFGQGAVSVKESIDQYYSNKNITDYEEKYLEGTLTSFTTIYLVFLSIMYTIAAILHPFEAYQVLNFVWYLICLPSGYLLLIVYSFCNLTDRSWGTREATVGSDTKPLSHYFKLMRDYVILLCTKCCMKPQKEEVKPIKAVQEKPEIPIEPVTKMEEEVKEKGYHYRREVDNPCLVSVMPGKKNHLSVEQFLDKFGLSEYANNFYEHGYENLALTTKLNKSDLNIMGITKRGHVLKILKALKEIYVFEAEIPAHIPTGIYEWLKMLCVPIKYGEVLTQEGYGFKCDIENLIGMEEQELINMGITKRGHLQRFKVGLKKLEYPTADELLLRHGHEYLGKLDDMPQGDFEDEDIFWYKLRDEILKVDTSVFQAKQEAKLKSNLEELRNNYLLVLIVANSIWLLGFFLLDSVQFSVLRIEGKVNLIGMIFVLIYGAIYFIQFICLLLHRVYTLMHFVADAQYFPRKRVQVKRRDPRFKNHTGSDLNKTDRTESVMSDDQNLFLQRHSKMVEFSSADRTPLLSPLTERGTSTNFGSIPIEQSTVLETSFMPGAYHVIK